MDLFTDEIMAELKKRDIECLCLHTGTMEQDLKELMQCLKNEETLDGVITFNNLGYNLGEDKGGNLWDTLGIPYINILMDHPFHYDRALKKAPQNSIVCCIDKNHVSYIKTFYPNIQKCCFLPHAGCQNALQKIQKENADSHGRDLDVVYAGALSRFLIEQLIPDFDEIREFDGAAFSKEALQKLIQNPWKTTEQVIYETLVQKQVFPDIFDQTKTGALVKKEEACLTENDRERLCRYMNQFRFLDGFATSYYREQSVRILVENKIPVHVLGLGWEKCDWTDNPYFIHEGKTEAKEVLPYMQRAKIVLNTETWFKAGAHDRIFNGMLCDAAVVSDTSSYLNETFITGKEMELFSLTAMEKLPAMVQNLLQDETRRKEVAENGKKAAEKAHTWKNRVDRLLHL